MTSRCWVNGQRTDVVTTTNRGLAYGDGVFETVLCRGNTPCLLAFHLQRLEQGCRRLGLAVPLLEPTLVEALATIASDFSVLKIIVTRAEPALGYAYSRDQSLAIVSLRSIDKPVTKPLRVGFYDEPITTSSRLAGIKHLSRLDHVLAARSAVLQGLDDLLLFDRDRYLIEATSSNVLVLHDQRWLTPIIDKSGVEGVMKRHIQTVIAVSETVISEQLLAECDSMVLCNAVRGVMPVAELAGRELKVRSAEELSQVIEKSFSA